MWKESRRLVRDYMHLAVLPLRACTSLYRCTTHTNRAVTSPYRLSIKRYQTRQIAKLATMSASEPATKKQKTEGYVLYYVCTYVSQ